MAKIKLHDKSFRASKEAESIDGCQDAYCINTKANRYAIADGATRSFYPAEWARLIVEHFCNNPSGLNKSLFLNSNWEEWLMPIQQEWYADIAKEVEKSEKYYVKNRFAKKEAAGSTFVGMEFNYVAENKQLHWQAMIVGDSCLFHVTKDTFESFLLTKSEEFTNFPECFASFSKDNHFTPKFISGEAKNGDVFLLATDALANWILRQKGVKNWEKVWNTFISLENEDDFERFIYNIRNDQHIPLDDDDVTLVVIFVGEKNIKSTRSSIGNFLVHKELEKNKKIRESVKKVPDKEVTLDGMTNEPYKQSKKLKQRQTILLFILFVSVSISIYFLLKTQTQKSYEFINNTKKVQAIAPGGAPTEGIETVVTIEQEAIPPPPIINSTKLGAKSKIYSNLNDNTSFLELTKETDAKKLNPDSNQKRIKIQFDAWVDKHHVIEKNKIAITSQVKLYSQPHRSKKNENEIGKLLATNMEFEKIDQHIEKEKIWYKIRIVGFIQE